MANSGIIGPINTTSKKRKPKVSVFTAPGTNTVAVCGSDTIATFTVTGTLTL